VYNTNIYLLKFTGIAHGAHDQGLKGSGVRVSVPGFGTRARGLGLVLLLLVLGWCSGLVFGAWSSRLVMLDSDYGARGSELRVWDCIRIMQTTTILLLLSCRQESRSPPSSQACVVM
jgi:hypothetical protein